MFKRLFLAGFIFIAVGFPVMVMLINSDEQLPWIMLLAAIFLIGSLIGNSYVFGPIERPRRARVTYVVLTILVILLAGGGFFYLAKA